MNQSNNIYASPDVVAAQPVATRAEFIKKTYLHLAGALGVFALLQVLFLNLASSLGIEDLLLGLMFNKIVWIGILLAFMGVSMVADKFARSATSKTSQYTGLAIGVFTWALLFTPLLLLVKLYTGDLDLVLKAGIITGALFGGLSFVALTTKKDFSFLGPILKIATFIALGLIVLSFFGFGLGTWFLVAMAVIASVSILYTTSNMIHHYRTDQYVSAALGLFASVALLLWYMINILLSLTSGD